MSLNSPVNADNKNRFAASPRRFFVAGYIRRHSNRDSKCRFLNDLKVVCESSGELLGKFAPRIEEKVIDGLDKDLFVRKANVVTHLLVHHLPSPLNQTKVARTSGRIAQFDAHAGGHDPCGFIAMSSY